MGDAPYQGRGEVIMARAANKSQRIKVFLLQDGKCAICGKDIYNNPFEVDFMKTKIKYDCRCLLDFVTQAETVWQDLGFESAEDMIRNGYELDPVEVEYALTWLEPKEHDEATKVLDAKEDNQ